MWKDWIIRSATVIHYVDVFETECQWGIRHAPIILTYVFEILKYLLKLVKITRNVFEKEVKLHFIVELVIVVPVFQILIELCAIFFWNTEIGINSSFNRCENKSHFAIHLLKENPKRRWSEVCISLYNDLFLHVAQCIGDFSINDLFWGGSGDSGRNVSGGSEHSLLKKITSQLKP